MEQEFSVIRKRMPDVSSNEKVTGAAKFISDTSLPGMLIGKVLHSPYAHARITNIDVSKAEKLPGVEAAVTFKDVPKKQYTGEILNFQSHSGIGKSGVYDVRILDEEVRYVGDAVAAVAAVNEKVAEEAIELIDVDYEQLPAVFDEIEAMKEGAPKIHDFIQRQQVDGNPGNEAVERNIGLHISQKSVGDVTKGFQEADYIIEETAYTSKQRQAPIETWNCIASFDAKGRLTLWTPTQLPHLIRKVIAYIFDMPTGMIRVKCEYIGGAFGAGHCMLREPLCVTLAQKSGKPVKLVYTRQEEFTDRQTRECFGPYTLKMGVKKDGTITAVERNVISKAGAYIECAAESSLVATAAANPLYKRSNYKVDIDAVYTNKVPCGAMRGFGNPEDTFVREQVMDEAAEKIRMDPLDFRLKNLCQVGDPGFFGPDFPITSSGMTDCIKIGAEKIGWKEKRGRKKEGVRRKGVGVSCTSHVSGPWPVHIQTSSALIKFNEDASVTLTVFPAPLGQGILGSLAQVAAEVLGLSYEDVHVIWGDTEFTLWETGSYGSRTMYIVGNAVLRAAAQAKGKLLHRAASKLDVTADTLDIKDKRIYVKANPEKGIPIAEITTEAIYNHHDVEQFTGSCVFTPSMCPPAYQALFTEVEVDTETGGVKVLKIVIENDSGMAINPMTVEGQLDGGMAQGLGYALWEEPIMDTNTGRVLTDDFDTYKVATTLDIPDLETELVEQPEPTGPFGAKGAGEQSCINQAASIANAIYDAVGVRIWELPITPEKVLLALKADKNANSKDMLGNSNP